MSKHIGHLAFTVVLLHKLTVNDEKYKHYFFLQISAQESRRKKKEYLEHLEKRYRLTVVVNFFGNVFIIFCDGWR